MNLSEKVKSKLRKVVGGVKGSDHVANISDKVTQATAVVASGAGKVQSAAAKVADNTGGKLSTKAAMVSAGAEKVTTGAKDLLAGEVVNISLIHDRENSEEYTVVIDGTGFNAEKIAKALTRVDVEIESTHHNIDMAVLRVKISEALCEKLKSSANKGEIKRNDPSKHRKKFLASVGLVGGLIALIVMTITAYFMAGSWFGLAGIGCIGAFVYVFWKDIGALPLRYMLSAGEEKKNQLIETVALAGKVGRKVTGIDTRSLKIRNITFVE